MLKAMQQIESLNGRQSESTRRSQNYFVALRQVVFTASNRMTTQPIIAVTLLRNIAWQLSPIVVRFTDAHPLTLVLSSSRIKRLYARKTNKYALFGLDRLTTDNLRGRVLSYQLGEMFFVPLIRPGYVSTVRSEFKKMQFVKSILRGSASYL